MKNFIEITDFTNNGECSNCGECCGDILHLSRQEIKRIERYLKKHKIKPNARCVLVDYDNTCPFRDNTNKRCMIYEVRPDICRVYKCNKSAQEALKNRELINKIRLPRSMRQLFFGDNKGAIWVKEMLHMDIYDRKNKKIGSDK